MSRYIQHYQTYEKTEIILAKINRFLTDTGYVAETYNGEYVYKKGDGWFSAPKFIKVTNIGGARVEIQAWIKWALLPYVFIGELNHTENSFIGAIDKSKIATTVKVINEIIMYNINATNDGAYYNVNPVTPVNNGAYYNGTPATPVNNGTYYNGTPATPVNNGTYYNGAPATPVNNGAYYNGNPVVQGNYEVQQNNSGENLYQSAPTPNVDRAGVTLKEFIEKYASQNIRKEIKSAAITGYVCSALTIIIGAALANVIGILLGILITALVLGFHLAKSKVCAIVWLVIVCLDCLASIILAGSLSGWIMIIAGICAIKAINNAEKAYNAFKLGL